MSDRQYITAVEVRAVDHYGPTSQMNKALEELSELINELVKHLRNDPRSSRAKVTEEMADVRIMLDQLSIIFENEEQVKAVMLEKARRLNDRIASEVEAYRKHVEEIQNSRLCDE